MQAYQPDPTVCNQLILVFPPLLPVKSVVFELGILKEAPGLHLLFYIWRVKYLYVSFWMFNAWAFSLSEKLYTPSENRSNNVC